MSTGKGGSGSSEGWYERPGDAERAKLRPVLELLDDQKPRLALKGVDGVLKKWPRSLRAATLRALCLARMGSTAESVAAAERVLACAPRDPELLSLLLLVLRPAGLAARVTPCYAAAWQQPGADAAVGEALFLCHVRDRDYVAQQQLIGQLAARFPRAPTPFLWWRVASLYAQARLVVVPSPPAGSATTTAAAAATAETGADGRYANTRLLALCEVLAARLLADGQMRTAGEAALYVAVLRDLRRDARLVELLEEEEGAARPRSTVAALMPLRVERLEVLAEAHEHLAHWARARAVYATLLRLPAAHRNWRHFEGLVRCAVAGDAVAAARALLAELRAARVERGVLLAEVELETRLSCGGGAAGAESAEDEGTARVCRALCTYAQHVCTKPACAVDLRPYVHELVAVRGMAPAALVAQLREACGACPSASDGDASEEEEKRPLEELCKEAFFFAVERMAGVHAGLDDAALEGVLRKMLRVYCAVLAREAPRDGAPSSADELAVVAAATFADVHARTGEEALLLEAACFLEEVLARTANNAQARLALIGVYTRLGALDGALAHFGSAYMGIKGVLLESCAHLVLPAAVAHCNAGGAAARLCAQVLAVHHENHTAVPEQLVQGYAAGAYVQTVDIARFHARLRRSALQRCALVERCLAQFLALAPADYAAAFARAGSIERLPPPVCAPADLDATTSDTRAALAAALAPVARGTPARPARTPPAFLMPSALARREAAAHVLLAAVALSSASDTAAADADLAAAVRTLDGALEDYNSDQDKDKDSSKSLAERIANTSLGDADAMERHCWDLFAAIAHFAVLAVSEGEGSEGNEESEKQLDETAAALEEAFAAVRAAVGADGAALVHTDFDAGCRALAALVTQGVCWGSVLLVAAARRVAGRGGRAAQRAAGVRTALGALAADLHGRALPALAQRLFRDPACAAAVNARLADPARAHVPAGFVARDAAADRVTAVLESRGSSLVAIIQSMSGLVATSF